MVNAYEGDTVASALSAAGVSVFTRGFKYHRPRGLLCVAGRCPNCLITVDDVPNVRACAEQVRPGMKVSHQNAWPSLQRDFLSILDYFHWLMPVGFYYKALHRPKWLWRFSQKIIRRVAGLGKIDIDARPDTHYHHQNLHADVAVIGGGPAGMSAALAAGEQGASVVLVDDQPSLGGSLRYDQRQYSDAAGFGNGTGVEIGRQLAERIAVAENIEVLSGGNAFGLYQDRLLAILQGNRLIKLRAAQVVIATGSYEVPLIFEQNDLPGVMLATGAQRLLSLYGVRPGTIAVVATSDDQGYYAANDLLDAGVRVAAVVDLRPSHTPGLDIVDSLRASNVELLTGHAVVKAEGKSR